MNLLVVSVINYQKFSEVNFTLLHTKNSKAGNCKLPALLCYALQELRCFTHLF